MRGVPRFFSELAQGGMLRALIWKLIKLSGWNFESYLSDWMTVLPNHGTAVFLIQRKDRYPSRVMQMLAPDASAVGKQQFIQPKLIGLATINHFSTQKLFDELRVLLFKLLHSFYSSFIKRLGRR